MYMSINIPTYTYVDIHAHIPSEDCTKRARFCRNLGGHLDTDSGCMHKLPAKFAWHPHVFRGVYVVNTRNKGVSVKCPAHKHSNTHTHELVALRLLMGSCRVE